MRVMQPTLEFQSTLPVWGGTILRQWRCHDRNISIHPPRVGMDGIPSPISRAHNNFNPPSPCGEGQQKLTKILCKLLR